MISVAIYSVGSPPAFTRTTADANYWQERLAYERSRMLYDLNIAGFVVTQPEQDDFSAQQSAIDSYLNDEGGLVDWIAAAVETQEEGGTPVAPPALPSTIDLTGQLGLANLLAQLDFNVELSLFRFGGSTEGGAGNLDLQPLVDILTDGLLHNGNPILELLAAQPITVLLSSPYNISEVKVAP